MKKSGCARCGNVIDAKYRPFCSKRCADIDLGSWFTGGYAIPSDEEPSEADIEEIIRHHSQPSNEE